jgi:hypothetical protein
LLAADVCRFSMEASMRTLRTLLVGPLVVVTILSSAASAQERHVVSTASLTAAVSEHVEKQDADRAAIREALSRPEVQELASATRVDLARMNAAVDTMNAADLERAADAARQVNNSLVGGASTVVISTTTIILVLLVLLIILVAVD